MIQHSCDSWGFFVRGSDGLAGENLPILVVEAEHKLSGWFRPSVLDQWAVLTVLRVCMQRFLLGVVTEGLVAAAVKRSVGSAPGTRVGPGQTNGKPKTT